MPYKHPANMTAILNPTVSVDDCPPLLPPGRARLNPPALLFHPAEPPVSEETDEADDPTPAAPPPLLGCCLGRALLLAGMPSVDELPTGLRDIARQALAETTDQPSARKWRQVAGYLRNRYGTPESLLEVTGPPKPPLPRLRFLLARRDDPLTCIFGIFEKVPARPLRWATDLPVLAWMAAHRAGALVIADREPDLRMRKLLSFTHLVFDCPLLKHLIP